MKLRVHSLILKAASKPFSEMLEPSWKEGRDVLRAETPVELSLPEDKAVGFQYICATTHHQNEMVPRSIAARDILAIAAMVDNYDFVNAMAVTNKAWLHSHDRNGDDLMLLTVAAYLFRDAQAFRALTKALILSYDGSYLGLWKQDFELMMS